ncbi:MAG: hypothetical protein IT457_09265 [Planctomycetes bacterium]|nr:hypothetical protein [Planctomycetota bacterium]
MTRPAPLPALGLLAVTCAASPLAAQGFAYDFQPSGREYVLNTASHVFQPPSGAPIVINGGVFVFRSVSIPAGTTVRAVGPNPLVLVVQNDVIIDGDLDLSGRDGASVDTLNSPNFPAPGGLGGPGGGRGGAGSPSSLGRDPRGETGYGPLDTPGIGGAGGLLACLAGCGRGSAGGGGSFASAGDLDHLLGAPAFPQAFGDGGAGCANQSLPGGQAGPRPFFDRAEDNDFLGDAIDVAALRVVRGELPFLLGGSGGGGGGDLGSDCSFGSPSWLNDSKGGGGGGGGGAVLIAAGRRVVVGPSGHLRADGGHGGGGEQAGSNSHGGGGGGGSGGMIVVFARGGVELHVKGETLRNGNAEFVISADGGIGTQGVFSGRPLLEKYPVAATRSALPAGGYGGLGLVQFVVPFGTNADGTNTVLDDGITVVSNGAVLTGANKTRFLAWRGFQNANGVFVDDAGRPTNRARGEGDLRPSPVLLPIL